MKKLLYLLVLLPFICQGQVGIGTTTPDKSAETHIHSKDNSRGFLIPVMTLLQCKAIVNPAKGLQVIASDAIQIWEWEQDKYGNWDKVLQKHARLCIYDGYHWTIVYSTPL